jgi:hypothetical protein
MIILIIYIACCVIALGSVAKEDASIEAKLVVILISPIFILYKIGMHLR